MRGEGEKEERERGEGEGEGEGRKKGKGGMKGEDRKYHNGSTIKLASNSQRIRQRQTNTC